MTHQKEKHRLVLEKYLVFGWVFARPFIIRSLLSTFTERGGAGHIEI